jgi:hypothetical protein
MVSIEHFQELAIVYTTRVYPKVSLKGYTSIYPLGQCPLGLFLLTLNSGLVTVGLNVRDSFPCMVSAICCQNNLARLSYLNAHDWFLWVEEWWMLHFAH